MPRKQHHYIYKTTCQVTGRYYIGMHSTSNLEDGYMGSGRRLRYSLKKYGKENHKVEILEFLPDRESLAKRESEIVNEQFLNDEFSMNMKAGGEGGGRLWSKEHAEKFHKAGGKKVFQLLNKRHVEKLKTDKTYKKKVSDSLKKTAMDSDTFGFSGRKHSEETKEKMSKKAKLRVGPNNSQFGTQWITDGSKNMKIQKSSPIPNGWKKGRII